MNFQRSIGHLLVTLLLLTQLALAQHFTVHFQETGATAPSQQQDHQSGSDEFKSIHILFSDLTKVLAFYGPDIPTPVFTETENIIVTVSILSQDRFSPYAARAPPAFSA